jgi:hypothetical protein
LSQAPSQIFPAILAIPIVEKDRIHRARRIFADLFEDELATGEKGGAIAQRELFFIKTQESHGQHDQTLPKITYQTMTRWIVDPIWVKTPRLGELAPFPSPVKKANFNAFAPCSMLESHTQQKETNTTPVIKLTAHIR